MFRYQILIEYVGSSFIGWQVQKKGKTIQGLIQKKISKLLDEKIIVTGSGRTDAGVHAIEQSAHFDCMNKIKNLKKFLNSINIIQNNRGWFVIKKLDFESMKMGAKKLIGTHDFSSFRASGCNAKSPIKLMKLVKIKKLKSKIEFEFRSQSFLKQQVRSMVGCLKFIGEKKWSIKKFVNVIKSKNRKLCAPPAPAEGLYLVKVKY